MYCTVLIKPNDEQWVAERLVDEQSSLSGDLPITEQKIGNTQTKIITVVCATLEDIAKIKANVQDDPAWHHNVQDNTAPIQEGLNLFRGTMTCQRYLSLDARDPGEYIVDAKL